MGKIKAYIEEWLQDCGYDLGYSMWNYPSIDDFDRIRDNKIKAREYYGKDK